MGVRRRGVSALCCASSSGDGMAGARKFFHIPAALSDETLIDNSFAQRVDGR